MTKNSETLDGEWLPAPPPPRNNRGKVSVGLKRIEDVRLEMSRVYRDCRSGVIDPAVGTKLTFILISIGKLIEVSDLESRVQYLENSDGIPSEKTHREP